MKNIYETPQIDIVVFDSNDQTNATATTSAVIGTNTKKFKYNEIEEID